MAMAIQSVVTDEIRNRAQMIWEAEVDRDPVDAGCCWIDYLPVDVYQQYGQEHDRQLEASGSISHGVGCHFCS